jgi:uncharacterized repeat protein (TIGR04052 family)
MSNKQYLAAACAAVTLAACTVAPPNNVSGEVKLNFAMKAGDQNIACGATVTGLGTSRSTVQIVDARFYVSNVRLVDAQGRAVPVNLQADGVWQSNRVALLDFEDATAGCREAGNQATRSTVAGTAPAGRYTGVMFDLGVPFDANHADVTKAAAPLNLPAMWWNWQGGYKFFRVDLKTDARAGENSWPIHLGSTGCGPAMQMNAGAAAANPHGAPSSGANSAQQIPPKEPCRSPNVPAIVLNGFDPSRSVIVADIATLLEQVNLAENTPMPPGCMSGPDDPDCGKLMPAFGVGSSQRLFRLEQR